MGSREIALWVDSRRLNALESTPGKNMEALMRAHLDRTYETCELNWLLLVNLDCAGKESVVD